jgi:hypothetical protein
MDGRCGSGIYYSFKLFALFNAGIKRNPAAGLALVQVIEHQDDGGADLNGAGAINDF